MKSKNTHIFDTAKDNDEDPKSPKLIHKNSEATKRDEIMDKNGNVVTDSKGPNTREDEDKVKLARRPSQVNPVPKPWWCDLELNIPQPQLRFFQNISLFTNSFSSSSSWLLLFLIYPEL